MEFVRPELAFRKFFVVRPACGKNQIFNPRFDTPDGVEDWTAFGTGATIVLTDGQQRHGAYCMKVTPAINLASGAYYASGLQVENGKSYTFSCDVRGAEGQALRVIIADASGTAKASNAFTATGYWQRKEVSWLSNVTIANYRVYVIADAAASSTPFYVDGAQFEQAAKATTFMQGYGAGCRWEGGARNSASIRSAVREGGGELVDLNDYCDVKQVVGLGHGDWNQTVVKMTRGGDFPQGHQMKSRVFSIIADVDGDTLGEIDRKRKALIDLTRPDLTGEERMIIRYQGIDANGNEATNPIDIYCKPLPDSLKDTADLPSSQRVAMHFTIPSGLLDGAYEEGKGLDLFAEFPANYIVKQDANGNWCKWTGAAYENLVKNITYSENGGVLCAAESPDGKVYVGGGFLSADGVANTAHLARWNPVTEQWESVISGLNSFVRCMAFDATGNLYIGGDFTSVGGISANYTAKLTNLSGVASAGTLGSGLNGSANSIVVGRQGEIYVGGIFTSAGGVTGTNRVAKWNPSTNSWSALAGGLNEEVLDMAIAPNGNLWIAGKFTKADGTNGDYLCFWDGTSFNPYWKPLLSTGTELVSFVLAIAFDEEGRLYIGGALATHFYPYARGVARWDGTHWDLMGGGVGGEVLHIFATAGKVFITGRLTPSGGYGFAEDNIRAWSNGTWIPFDVKLPDRYPGSRPFINSVLFAKDKSMYLAGNFTSAISGTNTKTGIAALNLNVASASANTHPFIQVHGPGKLISIRNHTTEKSVVFSDLTLQDGESVNLLFDPLNLRFESGWADRGNLTRYVLPGSDAGDFFLKPGVNHLSVFMEETADNSGAFIFWRPKFWGLDGAVYE